MIYLKNTPEIQVIRIPANGPKTDGQLTMRLVNTIDKGDGEAVMLTMSIAFARLVDANGAFVHDADGKQIIVAASGTDQSRLYYIVGIRLDADMPDGEYEYEALAGGEVISCGLAIVGEPRAAVTSYDNSVQYEQYN